MRTLDDTDRDILRLLLEDGRRPYSDIADRVDLSAPAVADRVERLESLGVVRSFTVDIDRSKLRGGTPVLVELDAAVEEAAGVADALAADERVEHVFRTAAGAIVLGATLPADEIRDLLADAGVLDRVDVERVRLLAGREWSPGLDDVALALTCDECDNTVTSEGVASELDGERYHFCCESCRTNFEARYESLRADA